MERERLHHQSRTVSHRAAAAAAACALALTFMSAPAVGEDNLVPHIEKGRATFMSVCGRCHGSDKPEEKDMDRPAWDKLITTMEAKGAKMTAEERELILDYLGIRNIFLSKCTGCHATERILDKSMPFRDWEKTVERMVAKGPDLLTPSEARSISAYLTVVRGAAPAAD